MPYLLLSVEGLIAGDVIDDGNRGERRRSLNIGQQYIY
jgi:hypothetical protein